MKERGELEVEILSDIDSGEGLGDHPEELEPDEAVAGFEMFMKIDDLDDHDSGAF